MAGSEAFGIVGYECERNCRPSAESNSFGLCRDARLLQIESLKYNKMKRIVGNEFGGERPAFRLVRPLSGGRDRSCGRVGAQGVS